MLFAYKYKNCHNIYQIFLRVDKCEIYIFSRMWYLLFILLRQFIKKFIELALYISALISGVPQAPKFWKFFRFFVDKS